MSPPARACARFGGFARGRWRIAMGAKARERRRRTGGGRTGAGREGARRSCVRIAVIVTIAAVAAVAVGARVRRDARPRRDVRFAFWRSNARHHSNPRETTPSAASPRSDIARVARLQVCGWASAFGAASARTRTHAGVPRTRRRFGRALFGSLISNGVTSADVMVAAAVADARCRPRSRRVARLRRRSAERGGGGKASAHRTRRAHADRELRPSAVLLFRSRSR